LWVLAGYSLAFGPDAGGGVIGNLAAFGLRDLAQRPATGMHAVQPQLAVPGLAFAAYMMMFAIITPALITGATAGRLKFSGYAVVIGLWSLIVYAPVAHWLFSPSGWLASRGAEDWAGGLVVHGTAGGAVLALLVVIGRRRRWPDAAIRPHSVPLVVLGAGLLWFGWFGFNGADGLHADGVAAQAVINTQVAAAAAMLAWLVVERFSDGHATVLGAVTGAVAGLATITPRAGFVDTYAAVIIGGLAGVICHLALRLKLLLRLDDALDVIAVHLVGGVLGTFLLGLFGDKSVNPIGRDGLFFGGGGHLLAWQVLAIVVVVGYSFGVTWIIASAVLRGPHRGCRLPPRRNLACVPGNAITEQGHLRRPRPLLGHRQRLQWRHRCQRQPHGNSGPAVRHRRFRPRGNASLIFLLPAIGLVFRNPA
jgi:ammonium transporter, Amt family